MVRLCRYYILAILLAISAYCSGQNKPVKTQRANLNRDSAKLELLDDNEYLNYHANADSIVIEIFIGEKRVAVAPATFSKFIDFSFFSEVKYKSENNSKKKLLRVQLFTTRN